MTSMADAFSFATSFNADISEWDVSSVKDMSKAFYACNAFDADISKWDVSAVENFESTFYGDFVFNQDISGWDTSAATTMNQVKETPAPPTFPSGLVRAFLLVLCMHERLTPHHRPRYRCSASARRWTRTSARGPSRRSPT